MDVLVSRTRKKPLELQFLAEPEEVAALRRILRLHLTHWRLRDLIEAAQLCVSELVTNVITHVGRGTPTMLTLSVSGNHLRIEVRDPDARALPTLLSASPGGETGRGLVMLDAMAARWGVILTASGKTTWAELECESAAAVEAGRTRDDRVARASSLLSHYRDGAPHLWGITPLGLATAERNAIDLITDVLHWLSAHGCDPDEVLDHAQTQFEAM